MTLRQQRKRLGALTTVYGQGASQGVGRLMLFWLLGSVATTVGVSWNGSSSAVALWGSTLPGFGTGRPREATLQLLLGEFLSWGWLVALATYALPSVLLPLASSYSVSATLWSRLTPATPREVAVARLSSVLGSAALLSFLGAIWALACATYHQLPAAPLLGQAAGLPAHLLFGAGVVAVLGPYLRTEAGRPLSAFLALILPVASFLMFATLAFRAQGTWKSWWPYACPFVDGGGGQGQHFAAIAAGGCLLLALSVAMQTGRIVHSLPATSEGIST